MGLSCTACQPSTTISYCIPTGGAGGRACLSGGIYSAGDGTAVALAATAWLACRTACTAYPGYGAAIASTAAASIRPL